VASECLLCKKNDVVRKRPINVQTAWCRVGSPVAGEKGKAGFKPLSVNRSPVEPNVHSDRVRAGRRGLRQRGISPDERSIIRSCSSCQDATSAATLQRLPGLAKRWPRREAAAGLAESVRGEICPWKVRTMPSAPREVAVTATTASGHDPQLTAKWRLISHLEILDVLDVLCQATSPFEGEVRIQGQRFTHRWGEAPDEPPFPSGF
jgi:hypothetical protein